MKRKNKETAILSFQINKADNNDYNDPGQHIVGDGKQILQAAADLEAAHAEGGGHANHCQDSGENVDKFSEPSLCLFCPQHRLKQIADHG